MQFFPEPVIGPLLDRILERALQEGVSSFSVLKHTVGKAWINRPSSEKAMN
jgi:hypothetical protein